MISSPLRFKEPCSQKKGERQTQVRRAAAAINHLIRMRHLFMTGVMKGWRTFSKNYENAFILLKLAIILKVQPRKLYNNRYMIASTQITNT